MYFKICPSRSEQPAAFHYCVVSCGNNHVCTPPVPCMTSMSVITREMQEGTEHILFSRHKQWNLILYAPKSCQSYRVPVGDQTMVSKLRTVIITLRGETCLGSRSWRRRRRKEEREGGAERKRWDNTTCWDSQVTGDMHWKKPEALGEWQALGRD